MGEDVEDLSKDAAQFRCLVPFPDQSESFTLGFEAGMIWQRMVDGQLEIGGLDEIATHISNAPVFERMANACAYDLEISDAGDGWMIATFKKRKRRFKVVSSEASE